jgi:hypothetical protein
MRRGLADKLVLEQLKAAAKSRVELSRAERQYMEFKVADSKGLGG